jgi:hypothetical protein
MLQPLNFGIKTTDQRPREIEKEKVVLGKAAAQLLGVSLQDPLPNGLNLTHYEEFKSRIELTTLELPLLKTDIDDIIKRREISEKINGYRVSSLVKGSTQSEKWLNDSISLEQSIPILDCAILPEKIRLSEEASKILLQLMRPEKPDIIHVKNDDHPQSEACI